MNRSSSFSLCALATAAALVLTLPACSKKEAAPAASAPVSAPAQTAPSAAPASSAAASTGNPSPVQTQTSPAQANPQAKLNLYIECYNHANSSFQKSLNRYKSWVKNMETGPTGNERIVYGLYSASGAQSCQKAVEQANPMPPKMAELEQAASSFAASLGPLEGTINEASTYYDRENYKDDGFAKGKALHQTLADQAKVFTAASRQFSDALDAANDAQQLAQLQRMEKEGGRNLSYYHLSTMIQAKTLMRLFEQDDVDIAKVGEHINAFEQTIDDMGKAPGNKPMMWNSYEQNVDEFRKAAKGLYRRLRDKAPYSTGEKSLLGTSGGWMVEGSPDKLLNSYNTMVETSNRLN